MNQYIWRKMPCWDCNKNYHYLNSIWHNGKYKSWLWCLREMTNHDRPRLSAWYKKMLTSIINTHGVTNTHDVINKTAESKFVSPYWAWKWLWMIFNGDIVPGQRVSGQPTRRLTRNTKDILSKKTGDRSSSFGGRRWERRFWKRPVTCWRWTA